MEAKTRLLPVEQYSAHVLTWPTVVHDVVAIFASQACTTELIPAVNKDLVIGGFKSKL